MWFDKSNVICAAMTDGSSLLQLVGFLNQAIYKRSLAIEPPQPRVFVSNVFPWLCEEQMPATVSWHVSFCNCQRTIAPQHVT